MDSPTSIILEDGGTNQQPSSVSKGPQTSAPSETANTDELTMRQVEAIDEEISSSTPLVSPVEAINGLEKEYREDPVYKEKISSLSTHYPFIRRMRPDGNCFYRAFSFGVLESLIGNQEKADQFHSSVVKSKELLNSTGFNQFTVDDFYDTFLELLERVRKGITLQELEEAFREPSLADYLVVYLRIVTSAELRRNSDFYQNFIESKSVEEFCQLEVEPMYKESDHIHIIGLSKVLGVGVRVVYVDRGPSTSHNFPEDDSEPVIVLLYRPGHYDIIYEAKVDGGKE